MNDRKRIIKLEASWEEMCNRIQAEATESQKWKERAMALEDALAEERAKQFDVDEPCPARTHHKYCDMWKQCPRVYRGYRARLEEDTHDKP